MKSAHVEPKAVIFDMDGTITRPILDFARIKREIGAGETPILEFLASIADEEKRETARAAVDRWEREAAHASTLNPGLREVLAFLAARDIPVAVLTRNSRESAETVTAKHGLHFDVIVTADDGLPPKPSPEPVRHIADRLGCDASEVIMVGDYRYDVECGREAGACTVFLTSEKHPADETGADYVIDDLPELLDIIGDASPDRAEAGEGCP